MHSKLFTTMGLFSLAAMATAQDFDHWARSASYPSELSSLYARDSEDSVEETLFIRDIIDLGSELLARAFSDLDDPDYAIYTRAVAKAQGASKYTVKPASSGRGGSKPSSANKSPNANSRKASPPKFSPSRASPKVAVNSGSSGGNVGGQIAQGLNSAAGIADGVGNVAQSVGGAVESIDQAGSTIGSAASGITDFLGGLFKREAYPYAYALAKAHAEANPGVFADLE